MKKTAEEWFKQLPPAIRKKAIANYSKRETYNSLGAVMMSQKFPWAGSEEGSRYWTSIYLRVIAGKYDKKGKRK